MHAPKRIVIAGGGVAGMELATWLGHKLGRHGKAAITLVDREAGHLWKPMLHAVAAGTRDGYLQQVPFVAHAAHHGFHFCPGPLCGLDRQRRRIEVAPLQDAQGRTILSSRHVDYDVLILAIGSCADDFGIDGVAEHCHHIDSQAEAEQFNRDLRTHVLRSLESGEPIDVAIVGGGATGVELAASLVQLVDNLGGYGAERLRSQTRIRLLEAGPRILPAFPERISARVRRQLEQLGVEVRTAAMVQKTTAKGFELKDGSTVEATLKVWAAGVKAPDEVTGLDGLETIKQQRIKVTRTLQTTRDEHIFALGDCAAFIPENGDTPLGPTAQVAHQQAQHLARQLPDWLDGKRELEPFTYHHFGALVSLGDYTAFGTLGRFGFFRGGFIRGRIAQFSHVMLYRSHQARLHGFWKGGLIWLIDRMSRWVRPSVRLQ